MRQFINIVEGVTDYPLFHGTDLFGAILILKDNTIRAHANLEGGTMMTDDPHGVSLTRSYRVAVEVGEWYERAFPVVLVLDHNALSQSYKINARSDPNTEEDEQEEFINRDITNLERYLISINTDESIFDKLIQDAETHVEIFDETKNYPMDAESWVAGLNHLREHPKLNVWKPR